MIIENEYILSIKYLPSVSWFANAYGKSELILSSSEIYRKENHPNRCNIVGANGIISLSIPLAGGRNQKSKMSELKISGTDWKRNHLQAIKSAYGKSPFFLYYFDELEKIINISGDNYFELCFALIKWLANELIPASTLIISTEEISVSINKLVSCKKYFQVFENKFGFQNDMSAIDLLFCLGPDSNKYLNSIKPDKE